MSRPLRLEYPGAWYHAMNRGRRGDDIFSGSNDYETFVTLLQEAAELWGVRVSAYCLMKNHYHVVLQTPLGNLSRFMRHINGVYTQRYNRSHGYDGQLFRGRYKSILVEEDSYLLELVRYIHRNPLRAGLVERLSDYPWSSHQSYLSSSVKWDWLCKDVIVSLLSSGKNRDTGYLQFVLEEDSEELLEILEKRRWPAMLGCVEFISRVKESFFVEKRNREIPESTQLAPGLEQILREVCRFYGVEQKDLLRARRGKENEPRNVAMYLCRTLRNDTLKEIGQAFGMTGYAPAGSAVGRVTKKLFEKCELQKRIEKIKKSLLA